MALLKRLLNAWNDLPHHGQQIAATTLFIVLASGAMAALMIHRRPQQWAAAIALSLCTAALAFLVQAARLLWGRPG